MTRIGKKRVFNNDPDSEEDSSCNVRSDSDREDDGDSDYDPKAGRPVRAVSHSSVKRDVSFSDLTRRIDIEEACQVRDSTQS